MLPYKQMQAHNIVTHWCEEYGNYFSIKATLKARNKMHMSVKIVGLSLLLMNVLFCLWNVLRTGRGHGHHHQMQVQGLRLHIIYDVLGHISANTGWNYVILGAF